MPLLFLLFLALASAGCDDRTSRSAALPDSVAARIGSTHEVVVSAAASLTDAFEEAAAEFEATHPGVEVVLNHAGSSTLREQILEGIPADVFASANRGNMNTVVEASMVLDEPRVFALNKLQVAVPKGNPVGVSGLRDFDDPELLIGLCAPGVPCGESARSALSRAGVTPSLDTNEPDVRALLTKLELGELDAGITYSTDVRSARGRIEGIDIPEEENVITEYLIAPLTGGKNPSAAVGFVAFVLSEAGRAILARHGFATP